MYMITTEISVVNLSILFPQYDDIMLSDSISMYVQILQERNHTHGKELF
jgi:hypothetical protein